MIVILSASKRNERFTSYVKQLKHDLSRINCKLSQVKFVNAGMKESLKQTHFDFQVWD